jgi:hypothetical protein
MISIKVNSRLSLTIGMADLFMCANCKHEGGVVAHRTPAQYRTVMVPQTVMVAPEGVQYEQIPAQYGVRQRVEMVAPARAYYVPVAPRCGNCGY